MNLLIPAGREGNPASLGGQSSQWGLPGSQSRNSLFKKNNNLAHNLAAACCNGPHKYPFSLFWQWSSQALPVSLLHFPWHRGGWQETKQVTLEVLGGSEGKTNERQVETGRKKRGKREKQQQSKP